VPLTDEQLAVLASFHTNRLTVVRAVPGSGKTLVFVEALKQVRADWTSPRQGIAALSFTNTAQEEIAQRLGHTLADPHFIGTLDGFLWRFIVRPFGHLHRSMHPDGPRLVPAPIAEHAAWSKVRFGPNPMDMTDLGSTNLRWNRAVSNYEAWVRTPLVHKAEHLGGQYRDRAIMGKYESFRRTGRLTHTDVHVVALDLLREAVTGPHIRALLAKRFPVVLIDEYQDTGATHAAVYELLLADEGFRSLVVGDPDQAIYGFGGADPRAFDSIESLPGCHRTSISRTHRFSPRLADLAKHLSRSGAEIHSEHPAEATQVLLLIHDQVNPDISAILATLRDLPLGKTGVLARRRLTVSRLKGVDNDANHPFGSGHCKALAMGCLHALAGETRAAVGVWEQTCGVLLLGTDDVDDGVLLRMGTSRIPWRMAILQALRRLADAQPGETWSVWIERCRREISGIAATLGLTPPSSLNVALPIPRKGKGNDVRSISVHPPVLTDEIEFLTIHGAKGREFDTVIYYNEKPHAGYAPCPSDAWWSAEEEEMETAFVAITRARNCLVLCLHQASFDRLQATRPDFVHHFGEPLHFAFEAKPRRRARQKTH
jgi:DNA helicase-2/ATP-dependent DNA helicase PcrA